MVEVIFYKGRDPLARAIRWWTGGRFSHCGFRLWYCLVVDIDLLHGVRARFDPWGARDTEAIQIPMDPVRLLSALYAGRWAGYSLKEGLRAKLPWFPDDPDRWNCSEMVNDLYLGASATCRTPDDVYILLKREV